MKDLKNMKRSELQKLAKQHGIKANMKNDSIIAALQKIFDENTESESEDKSVTESNQSAEFDLMAIKPPWNDTGSDFSSLNSSLATKITDSFDSSKNDGGSEDTKRSRSSSRNRTPKGSAIVQSNGKTFSVEHPKTKSRTQSGNGSQKKASKRRSNLADDEVIKNKRMRRSKSSDKNNGDDEPINEDLKNEIMEEIRKKIADSEGGNPKKVKEASNFTTRIPRFAAAGVTIGTSKPITPGNKDWNKLHNKQFDTLESIDDYEKRKKQRAERLLGSNKKNARALSKLAQSSKRGAPKIVKPVIRKGRPLPTFMSPKAENTAKTPKSIMKGTGTDGKTSQKKITKTANTSVFKPTVTSTRKINLNFAQQSSKAATPKRVTIVSDQGDKKQTYVKTPATGIRNRSMIGTPSERKSLVATPGTPRNTIPAATTPGGTKKLFDLKESLKKPMTWKAHKGPLRPYNDTTKKPSFQDRVKQIKNPPNVGTRDKRRQKMAAEKRAAKDKRIMQRRGIK